MAVVDGFAVVVLGTGLVDGFVRGCFEVALLVGVTLVLAAVVLSAAGLVAVGFCV